jgi:hypothetical protein
MKENMFENSAESIQAFQAEILALKEEEERAKAAKERGTAHFLGEEFNAEELTEEDKQMWERIKSKNINPGEFDAYRSSVLSAEEEKPVHHPTSREIFLAFLANKALPIFLEPYLNKEQ